MNVFITGGAGFIGSHIARYYLKRGHNVKVYDNLSRGKLLNKDIKAKYNWEELKKNKRCELVLADIRDKRRLNKEMSGSDVVFHMAAQTGVTSSLTDPRTDFSINCLGTFNVLEAVRKNNVKSMIYASTNKVYGDNVNKQVTLKEATTRWKAVRPFNRGLSESFSIDHCEHTPYGSSKLSGDIYAQDYSHLYGIKTGIFRMSCIYGTHQTGVEDQGWIAWFIIAALTGKKITVYGDGKQVRDILWAYDLIEAYDKFLKSSYKTGVYNIGGGYKNTTSILELFSLIESLTEIKIKYDQAPWRPADQEVYISDITKVSNELDWTPQTSVTSGVSQLVNWVSKNIKLFK